VSAMLRVSNMATKKEWLVLSVAIDWLHFAVCLTDTPFFWRQYASPPDWWSRMYRQSSKSRQLLWITWFIFVWWRFTWQRYVQNCNGVYFVFDALCEVL